MKKTAHTKHIKMETVTKDGIQNSTYAYITEYKAPKKEFVSVFVKPLFFFDAVGNDGTGNDVNTVRKKEDKKINLANSDAARKITQKIFFCPLSNEKFKKTATVCQNNMTIALISYTVFHFVRVTIMTMF